MVQQDQQVRPLQLRLLDQQGHLVRMDLTLPRLPQVQIRPLILGFQECLCLLEDHVLPPVQMGRRLQDHQSHPLDQVNHAHPEVQKDQLVQLVHVSQVLPEAQTGQLILMGQADLPNLFTILKKR